MVIFLYGALFLLSAVALYFSGDRVVSGLSKLSRLLGVREFVVAFFVMAAAASLPNLFIGIGSALKGIPELSLGDIFGNNFIAMTLAASAAVFFAPRGYVEAGGETIKTSAVFTAVAAVLPVLLTADGILGRFDALVLLAFFGLYIRVLLTHRDNFNRVYNGEPVGLGIFGRIPAAFSEIKKVAGGIILLFIATYGIISSASFFAVYFKVPLVFVGLLVTGLGSALPEIYFSIVSARRGETALIIGNLMGSVIWPATFVLGLVALIHPISADAFGLLALSRGFLFVAATLFFLFTLTRARITRLEAAILFALYLTFIVVSLKFI